MHPNTSAPSIEFIIFCNDGIKRNCKRETLRIKLEENEFRATNRFEGSSNIRINLKYKIWCFENIISISFSLVRTTLKND